MVQIIDAKQSGLSRFLQHAEPGIDVVSQHLLENKKHHRQQEALKEKESRELAQRKAAAKALGISEDVTDPTLQGTLYKESRKDARNQALMERLGALGSGGEGQLGGLGDSDILGIGVENPQLAGLLQRQKEANEKFQFKKQEVEREPIKKSVQSFYDKLDEDSNKIDQMSISLESMLDAVNRGDVDPFSQAHLAEVATAFGVPESLTRIFQTPGSKEFNTARKAFLSSTLKDAFRGATTGKEIELAESLLAQVGLRQEANQAALFLLQSDLMVKQERQRLAEEAKAQGISNYDIPAYVKNKLKPYQKQLSKEYLEAVRELSRKK